MAAIPDWSKGAVYQICVPSWQDGNHDGLGDLPGVISRLDYLAWLGVSAIWLSPIYVTEFFDLGYDVIDHQAVDPRFGTEGDFDKLITEAHRLGLRVVLDFVPNHTSASHPWFKESRSSREDGRRDWYIWRDGRAGKLPNNWTTQFETSAWTWDEGTEQFYLHSFHSTQPDLNWTNPDVMKAMEDVLRFWLSRGVDGFRIDALVHLAKDPLLRDNPPAPGRAPDEWPTWPMTPAFTQDQAGLSPLMRELVSVVNEYPGRILIGENHLPVERLPAYHAAGLTHPVNSQLLDVEWEPASIRRAVDRYEGILPQEHWPNWVLGSHDNPRVATRWGESSVRVAAMFQLTLRGAAIVYYGEELGLPNVGLKYSEQRDPLGRLLPGRDQGRDGQRTPFPWDESPHLGFSSATPWLPSSHRHRQLNAQQQREDPGSVLTLYRELLRLPGSYRVLRDGHYRPLLQSDEIFAFARENEQDRLLIILNFSGHEVAQHLASAKGEIVLSTHLDRRHEIVDGVVKLRANEGVVLTTSTSTDR
jgi:alpha-glucosidase